MTPEKFKRIPKVMSVMTPFPFSIDIDEHIGKAKEMMTEYDIRHLPVKEKGKLVGVITDRDMRLALEPGFCVLPGKELQVRDACTIEAYIVGTTEPLDKVLLHMAEMQIGSALVVKEGKLAGIFTMTDACRAFGEFLRSLFPPTDDDYAA